MTLFPGRSPVICFAILLATAVAASSLDGTTGDDIMVGTDNDDEIHGFAGDDNISGGPGDDTLIRGPGSNIMTGGPGADRFIIEFLEDEPDEITDFRPEEGDTLSIVFSDRQQPVIGTERIRLNNKGGRHLSDA